MAPQWIGSSGTVSYRKGGRVKRTGLARVHKGEKVIPRGQVKKFEEATRKTKRKAGREM